MVDAPGTQQAPEGRFGTWIAQHARAVVLLWIVGIVAALAGSLGALGGGGLFAHLQQKEPYVASESNTGNERLISGDRAGGTVIVRVDGVDQAKQRSLGPKLQEAIDRTPHTRVVDSAYSPTAKRSPEAQAPYLSRSAPRSMVFVATLDAGLSKSAQEKSADAIAAQADHTVGHAGTTRVTGSVPVLKGITAQVEKDLRKGEGIAMPLTLVAMVLIFGGFVAAGVPLAGAVASIAGGLISLLGFAQILDLDATVVNIVTVLGLGLSIDYGLLIVSRFREELALLRSESQRDLHAELITRATARTVSTAGRTVLFSALTVAISVAGLVLFPASVTKAVGIASLSVVLVACASALTLVPACCALGGRRLASRAKVVSPDTGRFASLALFVQRHIGVSIVAVTALLLVCASPLHGLRQISSTTALMPKDDTQRVLMAQLRTDFPALAEPEVTVVAHTSVARAASWAQSDAAHRPHVTGVNPPRDLGDGYAAIGLRADHATPSNGQAKALVEDLRRHRAPFPTWVTGQQAKLMDYNAAILGRTPLVVGVVALATLVLLFGMTGSLVLPLKALLFNGLSLAATLGVLTWVFQEGHLEELLAYSSNDAVESMVPVILIAFGFGLAMDYEVFLLSRIVEAHEQGVEDRRAVAVGVQRSGRIVTSAALLMVLVMLGFAAAKMIIVKEIGVGLAISIALDATLIRMVLVPATMTLMGRWNWWAPRPLKRLHARFALRH